MLKKILQAAALAAAVLASVPGMAAETAPAQVKVYYGDLDLSDQVGIQTLDRRLARAIKDVCPSDNGVREMSRLRTISLCRTAKQAEIAPVRASVIAAASSGKTIFATAQ
jgi:UrcA family protein